MNDGGMGFTSNWLASEVSWSGPAGGGGYMRIACYRRTCRVPCNFGHTELAADNGQLTSQNYCGFFE